MLSNAFLRSIIDLYFFKKIFFFTTCNGESSRLEEDEKIENNIKNLFRLKKEINDTAIKETRNLFRLKKNEAIKDTVIEILETFWRIINQ